MTAALEGGELSAARPGRTLPPGKSRYTLYRRLGGTQGRSGRAENLVPTGIRSRTVQPVVSRYTDWANGPISYASYCVLLDDWSGLADRIVSRWLVCVITPSESQIELLETVVDENCLGLIWWPIWLKAEKPRNISLRITSAPTEIQIW